MGPLVGESELPEALLKAGKDLLEPHSSTDSLLDLLHVPILLPLDILSDFVVVKLGYWKQLGLTNWKI